MGEVGESDNEFTLSDTHSAKPRTILVRLGFSKGGRPSQAFQGRLWCTSTREEHCGYTSPRPRWVWGEIIMVLSAAAEKQLLCTTSPKGQSSSHTCKQPEAVCKEHISFASHHIVFRTACSTTALTVAML